MVFDVMSCNGEEGFAAMNRRREDDGSLRVEISMGGLGDGDSCPRCLG